LQNEIGLLRQNMDKMGSRVDNLSTSINILTNMQGVLVDKVVDFKVKENSAKVLASHANTPYRSSRGVKGIIKSK
jgi:hypothetical protein